MRKNLKNMEKGVDKKMDFNFTEEQEMIKKMARNFAEKELLPIAAEIDKTENYPQEILKKMGELGFFGIYFPQEFGGQGLDFLSYILVMEEIARCCASSATIISASVTLGGASIEIDGTEEQKRRYLTPIAKGEKISALALTEPNAGSDVSSLSTTATLKNGDYVLNGTKQFITNGNIAEIITVYATVDKSKGHKGITAFILEKGTPGFSIGKLEDKLGIRATATAELIFDNCRIPKENVLGGEEGIGKGFYNAMKTLDGGRISIASCAVGIAQAAFEAAIKFAKQRVQFKKPIIEHQAIQFMLADMCVEIETARLLTYKAAWLKDQKKKYSKESAMAKLYAAEVACKVADRAIQIHGGYGYIKEYPVERYWRDARIKRIYEGTSEIQRIVIANNILKEFA